MNLSGFEIQIMFCVLILLGLLSVALVVDYLKGMNEKLRERHIDLLSRHETVVNRVEDDNARLLRALAEQSKAFREMTKRPIVVSNFANQNQAPAISSEPVAQIASAPLTVPIAEILRLEIEASAAAHGTAYNTVADSKVSRHEEHEEALPPKAQQAVEAQLPQNVIRIRLTPDAGRSDSKREEAEEVQRQIEALQSARADLAEKAVGEPDFDTFMERLVTEFEPSPGLEERAAGIEALAQMVESRNSPAGEARPNLAVPHGNHPSAVLNQLLERKELLSGLVVSIGMNDYLKLDEIFGHDAAGKLLNSVESLMESVAGENGFCSRRSDDEFVLIYPELNGARAQQRLSEISEQLWDYQLQTLKTYSVVFSWGASEAQKQPLAEAISTASEHMAETRNSRKSSTSDRSRRQRATA